MLSVCYHKKYDMSNNGLERRKDNEYFYDITKL